MGIFGKEKQQNLDDGHNHDLFNDDDDVFDSSSWERRKARVSAPHALTPDEVLHNGTDEIEMTHSDRKPQSVYERMKANEQKEVETGFDDSYVPSWAKTTESKAEVKEAKLKNHEEIPTPVVTQKRPEVSSEFLERCKKAVDLASAANQTIDSVEQTESVKDIPVEPEKQEPKKLDADEILRKLRGENFFVEAEVLQPTKHVEEKKEETKTKVQEIEVVHTEQVKEVVMQPSLEDQTEGKEIKVEVEVISTDAPSEIMVTDDSDVKFFGKEEDGATKKIASLDVDNEKTMMFGNLEEIIASKADSEFNIPYKHDDEEYDEEYEEDYYKQPYYETEDKDLEGIDDYKTLSDSARLRVDLASKKAKKNIHFAFSLITTILLLFVSSPLGAVLGAKSVAMINLILLVATLIINFDVFADFKGLFRGKPTFDSCVAIASLVMCIQTAVCAFMGGGSLARFAAVATLLLAVNSFAKKTKLSRILIGLERISNSEQKRAVVSAFDKEGNTISSGAVEGEAVVLCGKSGENVTEYIKNSNYKSPFDQKILILLTTGFAVALFVGVVAGILGNALLGLTLFSLALCAAYPASAALTCELPMLLATKRAARYGAMMAGFKGAYNLNLANAVAVKTSDLFPGGTVKLYNMKPLGNNDIGETLVDAAAVALAANSPLASIFCDIIGDVSEKDMPKAGGAQYEDKMGVSGWIGDKTILIGNRNLMQGHNVAVPPLSVDKKILHAGYFPVYVASCGEPCLLFVVKYETDPNITTELQRLCNTGVTVVVDPEDPNQTDLMLCNYFGLPNDAIKVMNNNGRVAHEKLTKFEQSVTADASFSKTVCGFFSVVTSAIKLPHIYTALTVIFIIAAVLGTVMLGYTVLTNTFSLVTSITFVAFQSLFIAISAITAVIKNK